MAKQTINLGAAPTGAGGDTRRSAFTKVQANFDEIYASGLVERGSNAMGEWTRWLDGTMITWGAQVVTVQCLAGQSVFWNPLAAVNQPFPFADAPISSLTYGFMAGAGGTGDTLYSTMQSFASAGGRPITGGVNMGTKPSLSHPSYTYGTTTAQSYVIYFTSVGRWK